MTDTCDGIEIRRGRQEPPPQLRRPVPDFAKGLRAAADTGDFTVALNLLKATPDIGSVEQRAAITRDRVQAALAVVSADWDHLAGRDTLDMPSGLAELVRHWSHVRRAIEEGKESSSDWAPPAALSIARLKALSSRADGFPSGVPGGDLNSLASEADIVESLFLVRAIETAYAAVIGERGIRSNGKLEEIRALTGPEMSRMAGNEKKFFVKSLLSLTDTLRYAFALDPGWNRCPQECPTCPRDGWLSEVVSAPWGDVPAQGNRERKSWQVEHWLENRPPPERKLRAMAFSDAAQGVCNIRNTTLLGHLDRLLTKGEVALVRRFADVSLEVVFRAAVHATWRGESRDLPEPAFQETWMWMAKAVRDARQTICDLANFTEEEARQPAPQGSVASQAASTGANA